LHTIPYITQTMTAKRILLIGASKNIGYHILEYLAPQPDKYALFVLARTPAAKIVPFEGQENVTFVQGDGRDETTVGNVIHSTMQGNVDFVIITVGRRPAHALQTNK
jgi:NAD(P)-dependent dehydrogenase (short-subunit alcohol dehydrogenase family)